MSTTVLIIASLHAVPVFLTAALTDSLAKTTTAALAMSGIAVGFGGNAYTAADLAAIWLMYVFCFKGMGYPHRPAAALEPEPAPAPEQTPPAKKDFIDEANDHLWSMISVPMILLGLILGVAWHFIANAPLEAPVESADQSADGLSPTLIEAQALVAAKTKPAKEVNRSKVQIKSEGDARKCLDLDSDAAVAACAENYR